MLKVLFFVGFGLVAFLATFSFFWAVVCAIAGLALGAIFEDYF